MKPALTSTRGRLIGLGALAMALGVGAVVQAADTDEPISYSADSAFTDLVNERAQLGEPSADSDLKIATIADDAPARPADTGASLITGGATFVPVSPYRTYDSRAYSDGLLRRNTEVYFDVITDYANVPMIPANAVAVTYNLTVTGTIGAGGFLSVFPADINWPGNSSINWFSAGISLANGGTVALGNYTAPGQISVYCGDVNLTATDFIVDITGYYI